MGLKRHLSAAEIVGQVMMARYWMVQNPEWLQRNQQPVDAKISNIVFMGMGEPLDNVEEVLKAVRIVTEPSGLSLSLKKVSVSTAGHLPGIKRFFERYPTGTLALSLHATNDRDRSRIMPINRKWPAREVLDYLREHYAIVHPKGHLLVQFTLISGVNDKDEHAAELIELLQGIPAKVNLIPLNPVGPSRLEAPEANYVEKFRDILHQAGIRVMIRYSKGQDIAAACGQLVTEQKAAH
jgi:23S rRNA (adenine2503-C2)-methyltransferase